VLHIFKSYIWYENKKSIMILPNKKIKIALIGYRLSTGGAEKWWPFVSVFLKNKDWKFTISLFDSVSYAYSGKLVNLGKMKFNGLFLINGNGWCFLKRYLDENNFDFIMISISNKTHSGINSKISIKRNLFFTVHSFDWSLYAKLVFS
jgi:N-acetylgalactosamine-N,N'-diacetylbacillosaminyl-diphospho-undecaprenol 4-alpha-N-acetylgalactosaminyltransferase